MVSSSPPKEKAVMILLASVSSGILAIWPNRERRRAWTIADRCGCPVVRLTSSFQWVVNCNISTSFTTYPFIVS